MGRTFNLLCKGRTQVNDPTERLFWYGVICGFVWGFIQGKVSSHFKYQAKEKERLERARLSRGLTQWR
jgi:hypothetical protein